MAEDPSTRQAIWDRFIDDLDRAGQAGTSADVVLPSLGPELHAGTRFGDLTRVDLENLSRLATSLGRRTDIVVVMWQDMDRRRKAKAKAKKAEQSKRD